MLNIKLNKAALRSFIQRRKMNALGLLIITAASAVITLLCALTGFARTNILVIITVLLIALCLSHCCAGAGASARCIFGFTARRSSRKKKHKYRVEGGCQPSPLSLHRTYRSGIRRYIVTRNSSISQVIGKRIDQTRSVLLLIGDSKDFLA